MIEVSIHASPQRQGELRRQLHGFVIAMFQSTPHLSGKANSLSGRAPIGEGVSIHASPQRQGERRKRLRFDFCFGFQSTPHLSGKANTIS